ncbi:hypothetical protein F5J12DRAFT_312397 [Pisolithus orientalis]|uniref:uncharacterized protein n=1 Tax=Pisolithus orientalis TaxID=936130 RepID=UPI002223F5C0|nr:uncharacterized protein F5J12DRAFT_312397 [Pisolithus orientalis]KAI6030859.1 hypothetical protein F5J12DRAFT_312397 [Pisolithus orientalis]
MRFVCFLSVMSVFPVLITGAPVGFGRVIPVYVFHGAAQSPAYRTAAGNPVVQTPDVLAINAGDFNGPSLESIVRSVKPVRYLTNAYTEVTVYVQQLVNTAD